VPGEGLWSWLWCWMKSSMAALSSLVDTTAELAFGEHREPAFNQIEP
jgi:hypothetical protein